VAYECFAWVMIEADGKEGVIAAVMLDNEVLGIIPLFARERYIVEGFEPLARKHGANAGVPVRMVRLMEVSDD